MPEKPDTPPKTAMLEVRASDIWRLRRYWPVTEDAMRRAVLEDLTNEERLMLLKEQESK